MASISDFGNTAFQNLLNFKGYGNIEGHIWFIGIEEALEIKAKNLKDYTENIVCSPKDTFTIDPKQQIYQIIAKLLNQSIYMGKDYSQVWELLFTCKGDMFQTNLFPLSKPSEKSSLSSAYENLFDIQYCTLARVYFKEILNYRQELIRKMWIDNNPKVVICFGKGNWHRFNEIFRVETSEFTIENRSFLINLNKGIILSPFFSYRFLSNNVIMELSNLINDVLTVRNSA